MKQISLDCLTLPDVSPVDLIRIAADAGYSSVSLWVQPPALHEPMFATRAMRADICRALADSGVALGNLEVFNLNSDGTISDYKEALEFGAGMGARSATAINFGSPREDIAERFAAFHEHAAQLGLETYLEPISMGLTRTLQDGVDLIETAGVEAKLVVDILHLMRTGGSVASLASIDPRWIGYVQICDGPVDITKDQIGAEAMTNRLYPGEGAFPLRNLLQAVPPGALLGVEAPSLSRQQGGLSAIERARAAMAATRNVLKPFDEERL